MDCTFIKLYLEAYERGQLDSRRRQGIKEHLDSCEDCSNELAEIHEVNAMFDEIKAPSLPLDFTDTIMHQIKASKTIIPKKNKFVLQELGKWGASLVAAGLILLVLNFTSIGVNIATISANIVKIEKNPININKIIEYSPVNIFNKGLDQLDFINEIFGSRR